MLTARPVSWPMAELDVLDIVATRKLMIAAQLAVVGVWRPKNCSIFLNVVAIIGGFAAASLQTPESRFYPAS